jgi:phosphate transport system permease protein
MDVETDAGKAPRSDGFLSKRRDKSTKRSVILTEQLARWSITVGGLLVILAVVGIMVFLVSVALPLAGGGKVEATQSYTLDPKKAVWLNGDEYKAIGVRVAADGAASAFHIATGTPVGQWQLDFGGAAATTIGAVLRRNQVLFGFQDGTVRFGVIDFNVSLVTPDRMPPNPQKLANGDLLSDGAIFTYVKTTDQYRRIAPVVTVEAPQKISDAAIIGADYRTGGTVERPTRSFVTFDADGVGRISRAETQRNLLTGKTQTRVRSATLPALPSGTLLSAVAMNSTADVIIVATTDGQLFRFDARDFAKPVLAERTRVFPQGVQITALAYMNSELALVVGGSNGAVDVYFRIHRDEASTTDKFELVRARSHEPHTAAVRNISVGQRAKTLITEDADGNVWMRHSTSDQVLAKLKHDMSGAGNTKIMLMPRNDGAVIVSDSGGARYMPFYFPHPESTLQAIFGKSWYEGYPHPTYTWQSSSGTDIFEPKFSLIPLIFGTLKATFYAMLFAVPISLFAAIYTSEFVHHRVRATIKPIMEMMESLPTVVLGFIAALILAPIVENWIGAVILSFVALPLGLMIAAYLWQLLPPTLAIKLGGIPKFIAMIGVILGFAWISYRLGPMFERALFYGDFKAWTNGSVGTGTPFMFLLLSPLMLFVAGSLVRRFFGTALRNRMRELPKTAAARLDMLRWIGVMLGGFALAYAVAVFLTTVGYDPRGGIVDTYVQRNALVVGFVMGFAIIPNIYTLAEDAMNSVPSHLRSASLAAGATPWQTAMWVVIPTAMSGIFAAVMIGMGRAVGETMIVVMAAGNTPILDWNIFNGLRTLSANIAVELPEAVKDGTLYRVLFLAALTLFIMTFVVNTVAEIIRQRFRKRAFQL